MCTGPGHWICPPPPPPPAHPPPARTVPPRNYLPETRYRDSSDLPVRNRLPGGWGGGGRESRARPSLPISIRYKRDRVRIRVKGVAEPSVEKMREAIRKEIKTVKEKFLVDILSPKGKTVLEKQDPKRTRPFGSTSTWMSCAWS